MTRTLTRLSAVAAAIVAFALVSDIQPLKSGFVVLAEDNGFYLSMPIAYSGSRLNCNGGTGDCGWIISAFDHSMAGSYAEDGIIRAFDGSEAVVPLPRRGYLGGSNDQHCDAGNIANSWHFSLGGHYRGAPATGYQQRLCYDGHPGIDMYAPAGTTVVAAADGWVRYDSADDNCDSCVNTIKIEHQGYPYTTWYMHIQTSGRVANNTWVFRGQPIALVGADGTTDAHLHFEVRRNGVPTDPFGWTGAGPDPYTLTPNVDLWTPPGNCSIPVGSGASDPQAFITAYRRGDGYRFLGCPIGPVHTWAAGTVQHFSYPGHTFVSGAIMLENGAATAWMVYGSIWSKYDALGGADGTLGYPTGDARVLSVSQGLPAFVSDFKGGHVWLRSGGREAFATVGGIDAAYIAANGSAGCLGFPTTNEFVNTSGRPQTNFEGGYITTLDGVNYQAFCANATRIIGLAADLTFGNVLVGATRTAWLSIFNGGNSPLTVSGISYPPGFSGDWSGTIGPSQSQLVVVTFAPTAPINYGGTVTVHADQTSGTPTVVASGTGEASATRIIRVGQSLTFADVEVGSTVASSFLIHNTGNSTLTVTGISYPAGFSGSWSGTIAPGTAKSVTVLFAPTALANYGGTITVHGDQTSGTNTLPVSGRGVVTTPLAVSLTSNMLSPQTVGTSIQFTARGFGGLPPYQFKWWVYDGVTWTMAQNWGGPTFVWTPTSPIAAGRVGVWARDATTTADVSDVNRSLPFVITDPTSAPPLKAVGLTAHVPSPQPVGTTIQFTAIATGFDGGLAQYPAYEFKWWVYDGTTWTLAQDWGTATFFWTPTRALPAGSVRYWVRDASTTADVGTVNYSIPYVITGGPAITPLTAEAITSDVPSPQAAGTAIQFTGIANGGVPPYQFKWWVYDGTAWTMAQDWGSSTFVWTPSRSIAAGRVGFWVRDATMTADVGTVNHSVPYVITSAAGSAPLTMGGLTSDVPSPQAVGTSIQFTATASGGVAPYQFKWWVYDGIRWTMARDWGGATFVWTPTQSAAAGRVGVWARDVTTTADVSNVNHSIPYVITGGLGAGPLTVSGLTSDVPSPQAVGTSVQFTGTVTGGVPPYQFKWWVYDGTRWTMARDWGGATFVWTPTQSAAAGRVGFWVRDATTTADVSDVNYSTAYVVTGSSSGGGPLTVTGQTSDVASPQAVGTSIQFTAAASGGVAPYQFKWWVYDGVRWTMARDWGGATFVWTPTQSIAGGRVGFWVRDATTTADVSDVNYSMPYVIR
jgi:murein DD-endopeptidase MepM/ murein hydrolase activator NlpD